MVKVYKDFWSFEEFVVEEEVFGYYDIIKVRIKL